MSKDKRRRALLGRLAGLGWFARHGEVAATQALAIVLEESKLRDALLRYLGQLTHTDLGAVASFQPELVHDDRARPDLEGQDSRGHPLVVVEAKFGAELGSDQVRAYLTSQEVRLEDGVRGALVLLVPSYREPEAKSLLSTLGDQADEHNAPASISTAVDTWEQWMAVLSDAARELPADERDAVLCDLGQLRALCETMRGLDVPPLGVAARGHDLQKREDDLRRLVAEATARFRTPGSRLIRSGTNHISTSTAATYPGASRRSRTAVALSA